LLEGIRRGVQVSTGQVEIHRRVGEVGVAQQQLDRPEIGACFEQVRGIGVPQRLLALLMNLRQRSFTIDTIRFAANP
jgi:hypothetical protein